MITSFQNWLPTQLRVTVLKKTVGKELFLLSCTLNCSAVWFIKDPKWSIRCFLICKCKGKQNLRFISWQIKDNYWF